MRGTRVNSRNRRGVSPSHWPGPGGRPSAELRPFSRRRLSSARVLLCAVCARAAEQVGRKFVRPLRSGSRDRNKQWVGPASGDVRATKKSNRPADVQFVRSLARPSRMNVSRMAGAVGAAPAPASVSQFAAAAAAASE